MSPLSRVSGRSLVQVAGGIGAAALLSWGALPLSAQDFVPPPADGTSSPSTVGGREDYAPPTRGGTNGSSTIGGPLGAYEPPPNGQPQRGNNTIGGVRGCGEEDAPLALLAPLVGPIGRTANPRPTLTWYVYVENPMPVELHLYRYKDDGSSPSRFEEVFIRPVGTTTPGLMTYTLPATDDPLTVGSTYMWQVVVYCDSNLLEVGQFATADLEVVAPPDTLPNPLPTDPIVQAQAFGAAGLWYDALAAVSIAPTTPEQDAFRRQLLQQLADLEEAALEDAATEPEGADEISDQLRRAAGSEF